MPAHVDAPAYPGCKSNYIIGLTFGLSINFQLGSHNIVLNSGDALVFDGMALLHGVDGVIADTSPLVNLADSRLGIMLWERRMRPKVEVAISKHNDSEIDTDDLALFFNEDE